jgi:glycerol-3-phosphate dehydrogenase (NAD(P)+)
MHNTESAVFAQAIVEMGRIAGLLGGDPRSATWLPGVGDLFVTCNAGRTGRLGRLLGLGLGRDEAVAKMAGATLESLEILQVMRTATLGFESAGQLGREELPLLHHLAHVALDDRPARFPLELFFDERVSRLGTRSEVV